MGTKTRTKVIVAPQSEAQEVQRFIRNFDFESEATQINRRVGGIE